MYVATSRKYYVKVVTVSAWCRRRVAVVVQIDTMSHFIAYFRVYEREYAEKTALGFAACEHSHLKRTGPKYFHCKADNVSVHNGLERSEKEDKCQKCHSIYREHVNCKAPQCAYTLEKI